jgi:hypothetical protein
MDNNHLMVGDVRILLPAYTNDQAVKYLQGLYEEVLRWFQSGDYARIVYDKAKERGYTYEVNLKVPDDYFIVEDWPWQKQPTEVKHLLLMARNPLIRKEVSEWNLAPHILGLSFLTFLYGQMGGKRPPFSDRAIAKKESLELRAAGIHGYKFLDGSSRHAGQGTFNYVVIDDRDIETVQHQVKDEKSGQVDLFTREQYVVPSKRASASVRRIMSAVSRGEAALTDLADLLNATQADIHYLHFYAGSGGFWDRIHDVCRGYYLDLAVDYDDVVELCLQLDMDVTHPNDSAQAVGFEGCKASLGHLVSYEEVMEIIQDRLHNLMDCAVSLLPRYQGTDAGSTAVRNYLEGFIQEWSKEVDYKVKERLGGGKDFGGNYRDTAGQMVTGAAEDVEGPPDIDRAVAVLESRGVFVPSYSGHSLYDVLPAAYSSYSLEEFGRRLPGLPGELLGRVWSEAHRFWTGSGVSSLFSGQRNRIMSMAKVLLARLSKGCLTWLNGFTKRLLSRFPDGTYGYSDGDNAWQVFDGSGNMIFSLGLKVDTGEFIYMYLDKGEQVTGRTFDLSSLVSKLPVIGGGL